MSDPKKIAKAIKSFEFACRCNARGDDGSEECYEAARTRLFIIIYAGLAQRNAALARLRQLRRKRGIHDETQDETQMEAGPVCLYCAGNDMDIPCAYPGEQRDCPREKRLAYLGRLLAKLDNALEDA